MPEPTTPGEFDPETLREFLEARVFRETPVALILESLGSAPSVVAAPEIADAIETADLDAIEWTTLDVPQTPPHMS